MSSQNEKRHSATEKWKKIPVQTCKKNIIFCSGAKPPQVWFLAWGNMISHTKIQTPKNSKSVCTTNNEHYRIGHKQNVQIIENRQGRRYPENRKM